MCWNISCSALLIELLFFVNTDESISTVVHFRHTGIAKTNYAFLLTLLDYHKFLNEYSPLHL